LAYFNFGLFLLLVLIALFLIMLPIISEDSKIDWGKVDQDCNQDEDCITYRNYDFHLSCFEGNCKMMQKVLTRHDMLEAQRDLFVHVILSPAAALLAIIGIAFPKRYSKLLLFGRSERRLWIGIIYLGIAIMPWTLALLRLLVFWVGSSL